jgi:ribonucleotide monophosphatase NagD (HAD superfamily)
LDIKESVLSIAADYETVFADVYGVLFDGAVLYDTALSALETLKKNGKKVVLISNSTQISKEARTGYARRGLLQHVHYDEFLTSGEFLNYTIKNRPDKFSEIVGGKVNTVKCIFLGNANIFKGTHLLRTDAYEADILYVGVPRASYGAVRIDDIWDDEGNKVNTEDVTDRDWRTLRDSEGRKGLEEFELQLENCLHLNKTLLVANPDIFVNSLQEDTSEYISIITQGAVGARYEKLGGKVVYFGKPYGGIFKYAGRLVEAKGPILMVGDSPWTDIAGANACGIDSALVMTTGIAGEFLKKMSPYLPLDEKCKKLFGEISPKLTRFTSWATPKYFIKSFGEK